MTFMIADGVRPSNNERGYVLRRIIRRAVLHAYLLGARDLVLPDMVDAAVDVMGAAYPEIVASRETVEKVVEREEQAFRATLQRGVDMLGEIVERGDVSGADAFFLHDTLGLPDRPDPRDRGRARPRGRRRRISNNGWPSSAHGPAPRPTKPAPRPPTPAVWRELLDEFGADRVHRSPGARSPRPTVDRAGGRRRARSTRPPRARRSRSCSTARPFYAESGGQVGDTGTIHGRGRPTARCSTCATRATASRGRSSCTSASCAVARLRDGDEVEAAIDGVRRDRIRRNHTATHILHWALREVLGTHVQQAGSMVAPDRLRFDFSHHDAVTPEQLAQVERLANEQVISDAPVRHYETTKAEAERIGAIAFFGEKYGEIVRVLEAGPSTELCGGTHVYALGFIGPIKIVSESSIGSNLRRIEAVTGDGALEYVKQEADCCAGAGALLRATPKEIPDKIERLSEQVRTLQDELQRFKAKDAVGRGRELAGQATDGSGHRPSRRPQQRAS